MWHFKSEIGVFWIAPVTSGDFELWFEDDRLGAYPTVEAAADDVYSQATGWDRWDKLSSPAKPRGINEWGRATW